VPVRLGPPLSAAAAAEPAVSMAHRPVITSGTSEDWRCQVRSARLHDRAERTSAHAASRGAESPPRVAWLVEGVRPHAPAGWRHDERMDDCADEPGRQVQVLEVQPGTAHFEQVLILAARVLAQDRHLASRIPHALESHVLAAFDGTRCAGFLRYLVQVIGAEEGRPGAGPR
jgi:hypothetical protein